MFDWGNWLIETVIAAFFISGFVIFYNSRLLSLWDFTHKRRLNSHITGTIFIYLMTIFCLAAAYWNPINTTAYFNWALYILFIPLLDTNITPKEFAIRGLGILGFWFYTNPVRAGGFFLSLAAVAIILGLVFRYHKRIHAYLRVNLAVATAIGLAFWLTQTQMLAVARVMGLVMFILMTLFTSLYWSSERLATLERNRLEHQVNVDALTKAGSFYAFRTDAKKAMTYAQKQQMPLTLVMFDIDHFKSVNDRFGHAAGNVVLAGVAKRVQAAIDANPELTAKLYRTGGEEFNLISPTAREAVLPVVQAIHQEIDATIFRYENQEIQVTLSMGVTSLNQGDLAFEDVYERADANLYLSKRSGRNCITVDGQLIS